MSGESPRYTMVLEEKVARILGYEYEQYPVIELCPGRSEVISFAIPSIEEPLVVVICKDFRDFLELYEKQKFAGNTILTPLEYLINAADAIAKFVKMTYPQTKAMLIASGITESYTPNELKNILWECSEYLDYILLEDQLDNLNKAVQNLIARRRSRRKRGK